MLRVGGSSPDLQPLEQFMQETFPTIALRERHRGTLQYQLPACRNSLAHVFSTLAAQRARYCLEDYSVSQTTLDQVGPLPAQGGSPSLWEPISQDRGQTGADSESSGVAPSAYPLYATKDGYLP